MQKWIVKYVCYPSESTNFLESYTFSTSPSDPIRSWSPSNANSVKQSVNAILSDTKMGRTSTSLLPFHYDDRATGQSSKTDSLWGNKSGPMRCVLWRMFRTLFQKIVPLPLATCLQWKQSCFYKVYLARANWTIDSGWTNWKLPRMTGHLIGEG